MQLSMRDGIIQTANALGISPEHLATIISYETGGTFNPMQAGPTTQWGQHRGLIQFGEPQAQQYGVNWDDPIGSQLGPNGAIYKYLKAAGVQPGMGLLDVYSAVNAGSVGRYGASDAAAGGAPGTVYDKVTQQMAGHQAKAQSLLGGGYQAAGFGYQPGTYSGGEYVPAQRSVNYVPTGSAAGTAMGGYSGGPAQVAARSAEGVNVQSAGGPPPAAGAGGKGGAGNSPYERQMRQSMEREGRPDREIAQTMANAEGSGIPLPSMGGGKSLGGSQAPLSPAPVVKPLSDGAPGYELPPVITAPKPNMRPETQNMSLPPVQGPNQPYFATVDPAESELWDDTTRENSPGGVPYDSKKSPTYDRGRKRFLPPFIPR